MKIRITVRLPFKLMWPYLMGSIQDGRTLLRANTMAPILISESF